MCVCVGDKSDDHKQLVFPDTMLMLSLRTPYPLFFYLLTLLTFKQKTLVVVHKSYVKYF